MTNIGIIGVGVIGKLFVDELADTDHSVVAYDIDPDQVSYAVETGASEATGPADLTERSDVILIAVPGTPEVEQTMDGEDGVMESLETGQLIVDSSTTLPETSITYESRCADQGARFIEAPITGAAPRDGWHMMIGGTEENYEAASDILEIVCDDHIRVGEIGKATIFKLALQMRYAGHHALDAEIVEFARDNEVDPKLFNEFLEMGIWENYFTNDFSPAIEGMGGLAIWHKDIGYARQVGRENNTALPLNGAIHEAYKSTVRRSKPDEGHAASVIKYWRKLNEK